MIERIGSKRELRSAVSEARREGRTIGFVPTMGALHDGHLSLVRAACERTDFVVVSVFVNPTQFAAGEDFDSYPRSIDDDIVLLASEDVEVVFTPSEATMYGPNEQVWVEAGPLGERWEGEARPGHFRGVATIVAKLLNIVDADLAFFGEKDYQQLKVVEHVVADLDFPTGVIGLPIVRDGDGLALSSRNRYLTADERRTARAIPEALEAANRALAWGARSAAEVQEAITEVITAAGPSIELDYAAVVDPETLEPLDRVDGPARALIAARLGATRLIDNCPLVPVASEHATGGPHAD